MWNLKKTELLETKNRLVVARGGENGEILAEQSNRREK